jgi:hypothetical protein
MGEITQAYMMPYLSQKLHNKIILGEAFFLVANNTKPLHDPSEQTVWVKKQFKSSKQRNYHWMMVINWS